MDTGVLRLLYFLALVPLDGLAFHWLWIAAIDSAGLSRADAWKKRARANHRPHSARRFTRRMVAESPQPHKTRRLLGLYSLGLFPIFLCVSFSFFGLYDARFDTLLQWAVFIMPAIILLAGVCGLLYRRNQREAGADDAPRPTLAQDFRALKRDVYDPQYEAQLAHYGGSKAKMYLCGTVKLVLALAVMAGLFFLVARGCSGGYKKEVARADDMQAALASYGYAATDSTATCAAAWQAQDVLETALVAQSGAFFFEYAVFKNEDSASALWTQYRQHLEKAGMTSRLEHTGNYRILTLQDSETYAALVQVENTVVRAHARRDDSYIIREILMKNGYYYED
nr:hypothetical protein [Maliibacterium massiliense]